MICQKQARKQASEQATTDERVKRLPNTTMQVSQRGTCSFLKFAFSYKKSTKLTVCLCLPGRMILSCGRSSTSGHRKENGSCTVASRPHTHTRQKNSCTKPHTQTLHTQPPNACHPPLQHLRTYCPHR